MPRHSWPRIDEHREFDKKLDEAAREAARLIRSAINPTTTMSRFLIMLADSVQTTSSRPAKLDAR